MFQKKIQRIIDAIDDSIEIAKKESILLINADLQERIFNDGKDYQNNQIGVYAESTKKYKKKRGNKDTTKVNLIDTTSLNKSIQVKEIKIIFNNEYGEKVSAYNEVHFQKTIFAPSENEKKIFIETLNSEISKLWK